MATPALITSITLNRNSSEDITPQIPEYLYAYTDPNASGDTLYAWDDPEAGTSSEIYYNNAPMPRIYTNTLNPTVDSNLYDEYGTILDVTEFSDDERLPTIVALNSSTSSSGIYFELEQGGAWYCHYNRGNSSEDIVLPSSQPATLYTDSTTLTTGMTLYDDTGTDTGHKVGAISGDSFDIQVTNRSKLLLQNGNQSEVFNPQESQIILSSLFAWLDDRGIEHDSIEDISGFYGQFPSIVVANVIFNELSADYPMSNCIDHVNIAFLTNFDLSNYDMMPISFFINDVNAVDLSFYSEDFATNARNSLFNSEEDIHLEDIGGLFVDNITSNYGFNLSAFETSAFDTTGTLIASDLGTIPDEFRYLFSSWFDDEASQITTIDNFIIKIPFMQGVNPE